MVLVISEKGSGPSVGLYFWKTFCTMLPVENRSMTIQVVSISSHLIWKILLMIKYMSDSSKSGSTVVWIPILGFCNWAALWRSSPWKTEKPVGT